MNIELKPYSQTQTFFDKLCQKANKIVHEKCKDLIQSILSQGVSNAEHFKGMPINQEQRKGIAALKEDFFSIQRISSFHDLSEKDRKLAIEILQKAKAIIFIEFEDEDEGDLSPRSENIEYLKKIREEIEKGNWKEAFINLRALRFSFNQDDKVVSEIYNILHLLLPNLQPSQIFSETEDHERSLLRALLERTSKFAGLQRRLAIDLAKCYSRDISSDKPYESVLKGIHFFAKAIDISETYSLPDEEEVKLVNIHQAASHLLMRLISIQIIDSRVLVRFLLNNPKNPQLYEKAFKLIETLKSFCCHEEDIKEIKKTYQQVLEVLDQTRNNDQILIKHSEFARQEIYKNFELNKECITQTYWKRLKEYRSNFEKQFDLVSKDFSNYTKVRKFQKDRTEEFRIYFVGTIFKDALDLFLLDDSYYDFRGTGSFSRDEFCPYSDLEWMLLILKSEEKPKFLNLAKFVGCQLISLGETAMNSLPVFSSLGQGNSSGLHIDSGADLVDVIRTPSEMAQFQGKKEGQLTVNTPENMFLSSQSVLATDRSLFQRYQDEIRIYLPQKNRHLRGIQRIHERVGFFKRNWADYFENLKEIQLKDHFVEPLNYLISDMRIYFDIENTNTIEVIDVLTEKFKVFSPNSCKLLKEAVAAVYMIRVRLHLHSKEQVETVKVKGKHSNGFKLKPEEIAALKQAYWIVLVPLFDFLTGWLKEQIELPNIDFSMLLFEKIMKEANKTSQSWQISAMDAFIRELVQRNAPQEDYHAYYRKISTNRDLEHLRMAFLMTLKSLPGHENLIRSLSHIPNSEAFRQSSFLGRLRLEELLMAATSENEERGGLLTVKIEGSSFNRFLKRDLVKALIDEEGNIRKDYLNAINNVGYLESCGLHFKQQPVNSTSYSFYPGKEQAASSLMMRLFGHGVSNSRLVKFHVNHSYKKFNRTYLVLVSSTVLGTNLSEAKQFDIKKIDSRLLSDLFLSVPLILPGDLREANCIVTENGKEKNQSRGLVFIDNDISWVKPMTKNGSGFTIHLYFPLFLRFPDFILDRQSIEDFLLLKPGPLLAGWFKDLAEWNNSHYPLMHEFEKLRDGFSPFSLFEAGMGTQLMIQFCRLQTFLKTNISRPIYALEVLKTIIQVEDGGLIEVGEQLFKSYRAVQNNGKSPSENLQLLSGRKGNSSLSMTQSQAVMFHKLPTTGEEKKLCLPEQALLETENLVSLGFQDFFILQGKGNSKLENGFKRPGGNNIDPEAQKAILKGLMLYTYEKLNLSYCSVLTDSELKKFIEKSGQTLKFLDLRHCDLITEAFLPYLEEKCPLLEELYLSYCPKLKELVGYARIMKAPPLKFPRLKRLHVSHCSSIKTIRLIAPDLEILKADSNPLLSDASIQTKYEIEANFKNCPKVVRKLEGKERRPVGKQSSGALGNRNHAVSSRKNVFSDVDQTAFEAFKKALFEEVEKENPDILRRIEEYVKKEKEKFRYFQYIGTLISDQIKLKLQCFWNEHQEIDSDPFIPFYQYLLDLSQTRSTQAVKPKGRIYPLLSATRDLFIADSFDYAAESLLLSNQIINPTLLDDLSLLIDPRIERIHFLIRQGEQEVAKVVGKSCISLLGNTGVGKSTAINYFLGCPMEEKKDIEIQIVAKNPIARIGHDLVSETDIPGVFPLPDHDLFFCDMPGYLETRGPVANIANAVNIRHLLTAARANRVLFLINYHSLLTERGDGFKNAIRILTKFFGSDAELDRCMQSILIGVTRVPNDVDFNKVVQRIQKIAKLENWNLADYTDQIISLDPLERGFSPKKGEIIKKLEDLPEIEKVDQLYHTALSDEDKLLIQEIIKKSQQIVGHHLKGWNISGIIEEYHRLNSLRKINHPSIDQGIQELLAHIERRLSDVMSDIKLYASEPSGPNRVKSKFLLMKLDAFSQLDVCFLPVEGKISDQVKKIKDELKANELLKQDQIVIKIEDDLSYLIQEVVGALQEISNHHKGMLASIDLKLQNLLGVCAHRFKHSAFENLLHLFSQIEREKNLRPLKYIFPEVNKLESLVKKKGDEVQELIRSRCVQARISILVDSFNQAYENLFMTVEKVVSQQYAQLRQFKWDKKNLMLLVSFGFNGQDLQTLQSTITELEGLIQDIAPYHAKIERFINKILADAAELFKKKQVEAIESSIITLLKGNLESDDLMKLNLLFESLSGLDPQIFIKSVQYTRNILIDLPFRELGLIVPDEKYAAKVRQLCKRIESIRELTSCFKFADISETLTSRDNVIKEREVKRRAVELHPFTEGLPVQFEEAKAHIRKYVELHFEQMTKLNLNLEKPLAVLKVLEGVIPPLSSYFKMITELVQACKTEENRYAFIRDDQLKTLSLRYEAAFVDFLKSMVLLAKALSIQATAVGAFKEIEAEASKIVQQFPQKVIKYGLAAQGGFSAQKIEGLSAALSTFSRFVDQQGVPQEAREQYKRIKEQIDLFKVKIDRDAKEKAVESITAKIKKAALDRTFLNISDELEGMLEVLQQLSPKTYLTACEDLMTGLNGWQRDLEDTLNAEKYTDIINAYVGLEKLKKKLQKHLKIDNNALLQIIQKHMTTLMNEAIAEIEFSDETQEEKYFQLDKLKKFISVLKTFQSHQISLTADENGLKKRAQSVWTRIVNSIPLIISKRSDEPYEPILNKLAKQIIKNYAIANEWSLLKSFEGGMRNIFNVFSKSEEELIYKLGLLISEFKGQNSAIDAYARAVIGMFPEFERINIKWFNKKASGVTFDQALEGMTSEPPLTTDGKNILKRTYLTFQEYYSKFIQQIVNQKFDAVQHVLTIKKIAKELTPISTKLSSRLDEAACLLAHLFAQWTYLSSATSFFAGDSLTLLQPHNTQILSILRLIGLDNPNEIENHLAQIKTGEGKSISLGIIVAFFGLLGYDAYVISYSSYLSNRDEKLFRELFKSLTISHRISYTTNGGLVEKIYGKYLPDFREIVLSFLKGKSDLPSNSFGKKNSLLGNLFQDENPKKLLLLDEVDVFFGRNFYGQVKTPAVSLRCEGTERLLRYIWENRESLKILSLESAAEKLTALSSTQSILEEYPNFRPFLSSEIAKMMSELKSARYLHEHYVIEDNQVGQYDTFGNLGFSYYGYVITFAYFHYKDLGKITNEKHLLGHLSITMSCANILYSELPKFFELKLGLTATLKELSAEENAVLDLYGFTQRSFIPSTFNKKQLREEETIVIDGEKTDFFNCIKKEIDTVLNTNRAALVIFDHTKDVVEFLEYLKKTQRNNSRFTLPECLTENVPDQEKESIIARSMAQYRITLLTSLYGRGIDFVCRDSALIKNGGVHFIFATYAKTLADEIQFKGRTCRQDDPGSIRKILYAPELLEQKLIPGRTLEGKWIPDLHEFNETEDKNWDRYLSAKRDKKYQEQFQEINKTLERNTIRHQKSLRLVEAIKAKQNDEAIALLKEFN